MSAVQCVRQTTGFMDKPAVCVHFLRVEEKRQDDFGCFYSSSGVSVHFSFFAKLALIACVRSLSLSPWKWLHAIRAGMKSCFTCVYPRISPQLKPWLRI